VVEYIGNEFTYLLPGELIVTAGALKISTVLGSCVAVCLYDREKGIAGMNHYMLPYNKSNDPNIFRYGDTSLEEMLVQMINTGARKFNLAARIYGGSSMFMDTGSISCFNIGEQNVEVAIKFLKDKEISVKSVETGGKKGRKVVFDTSAGVISSNVLTEKKR
jgi:chemotaxis protein CheD